MKHVFGPVPSRRLGQSLGIDPVPLKTCNWNCVYCQLGRTKPLVNERKEYFPQEVIIDEVREALERDPERQIDWITFVGSGETMLHSGVGWMIRQVKAMTEIPVAVITNGSLLYQPDVRQELLAADAVLPTLDAGNAELYRQVNRPHPDVTFEKYLEGLVRFGEMYQGKLWVEVMLVRDLNDSEAALKEIAAALKRVQPDEVHIVQPTRPPVETWVKPPDEEGLLRARAILGDVARVIHPASGSFEMSEGESLVEAVIGIITRHPMREEELIETLNHWMPGETEATIEALKESRRAQIVRRHGIDFWSAAPSQYPQEAQSERTRPKHSEETHLKKHRD